MDLPTLASVASRGSLGATAGGGGGFPLAGVLVAAVVVEMAMLLLCLRHAIRSRLSARARDPGVPGRLPPLSTEGLVEEAERYLRDPALVMECRRRVLRSRGRHHGRRGDPG